MTPPRQIHQAQLACTPLQTCESVFLTYFPSKSPLMLCQWYFCKSTS
jgi:hypothetical protein